MLHSDCLSDYFWTNWLASRPIDSEGGKRFVLKEYITSSSYGISKGVSSSSRFFKEIAVSS